MIKVQKQEIISRMRLKKMMFLINFVIILELLVLDRFVESSLQRPLDELNELDELDEQETMNDFQHQQQPQYENNQFNEDMENLKQFSQEVEDADLERINYEIQSQAAKLNQLNDEPVYNQEQEGAHEIIEQTDIAYERPLIGRQYRQDHYVRSPNYERTNNRNQEYEVRYVERPRERHIERPRERPRERQQYYTYHRSHPPNQPNEEPEPQQHDQNSSSQQEEQPNDQQNTQTTQEDSQSDQQQQTEEPQQQQEQTPNSQTEDAPSQPTPEPTLPGKTDDQSTNLPKDKFGIHNNIFVIQAACGKLKVKKSKDDNRNVEKPIRKVKRRKTKRNERKRKHKRKKAKKIILIEEHNYVPAYKDANR